MYVIFLPKIAKMYVNVRYFFFQNQVGTLIDVRPPPHPKIHGGANFTIFNEKSCAPRCFGANFGVVRVIAPLK